MLGKLLSRRDPLPTGGEGPRGYVGGLWYELGELQFKFLVEQGLRPQHALLDIACGSLRLGTRAIPYLDVGNYLGIDLLADLIEHGKTVEVGQTMLGIKRPEFVVSPRFAFDRFSKVADFAIAQSLFTHLVKDDIALCLGNLATRRKASTVFFATFFETNKPVVNRSLSHPHDAFQYTRDEMADLGARCNWRMEYIGDWNHPRGQKMLRFVAAS